MSKRTVFNVSNRGHVSTDYPLFLGKGLGIHDTINIAFPIIEELYLSQRSVGWTEDEINLEQSRMDMLPIGKGGKTRPEEIDILNKVVSYLWEADSIASRSVISIFAPFVSNSELTAMLTEQTRFEVIHAKTYSEIVRQCSLDVDALIDETLENENILIRTDIIIEAFDDIIKHGSLYSLGDTYLLENGIVPPTRRKYMEVILKGVVALYLLERVQFMSSFAVVFGLGEHDKFKGIADLVKLICRDEGIHSRMMSNIINLLKRDAEWRDVFDDLQPTFVGMVNEVVEREKQWNNYLFSEGRSMVGLNTELLDEWVMYSARDLCETIGLPYEFEKIMTNPIPWVENWIDFDKVQNANQEADNIQYKMDAMTNDIDEEFVFDL